MGEARYKLTDKENEINMAATRITNGSDYDYMAGGLRGAAGGLVNVEAARSSILHININFANDTTLLAGAAAPSAAPNIGLVIDTRPLNPAAIVFDSDAQPWAGVIDMSAVPAVADSTPARPIIMIPAKDAVTFTRTTTAAAISPYINAGLGDITIHGESFVGGDTPDIVFDSDAQPWAGAIDMAADSAVALRGITPARPIIMIPAEDAVTFTGTITGAAISPYINAGLGGITVNDPFMSVVDPNIGWLDGTGVPLSPVIITGIDGVTFNSHPPKPPVRPQDELAAKVFDMLRNIQDQPNVRAEVSFDPAANKLGIKNAKLTMQHCETLFRIIQEDNITSLELKQGYNDPSKSNILDFLTHDKVLHSVDLSVSSLGVTNEVVQQQIRNVLTLNKTLKTLVLYCTLAIPRSQDEVEQFTSALKLNDTLQILDLSSSMKPQEYEVRLFSEALKVNRSLTALKLSISRVRDHMDANTISKFEAHQEIIKMELYENSHRSNVELAKVLATHYLASITNAEPAAAAKAPLYKPLFFLRKLYSNNDPQKLSLSHNLFKALWHADKTLDRELVPEIMVYAKELLYKHHLFEILGVVKSLPSAHLLSGARDILYGVFELLVPNDIKYQDTGVHIEEVSLAGAESAAVPSDIEGKE